MNDSTTYCIEAVTVTTTYNAAAITAVICYSYTSTYFTSNDYI